MDDVCKVIGMYKYSSENTTSSSLWILLQ